jgi:hypothetical protein
MADTYDDLRRALADLPKVEPWFVVGAPWGKGDFIVAGHPDPHVGRYVADTEDFDGEGEDVLEHAAFIAAANPATVSALLQERDALLLAARQQRIEANNPRTALAIRVLVAAGRLTQEEADNAFRLSCEAMAREGAGLKKPL